MPEDSSGSDSNTMPSLFGIIDAGVHEIDDDELTFTAKSEIIQIPAVPIDEPEENEIIYSPSTPEKH